MPTIGIEPTTYGLQNRCSTIEPSRQVTCLILYRKFFTVKSFFLLTFVYNYFVEYWRFNYAETMRAYFAFDNFKYFYDFCMVWAFEIQVGAAFACYPHKLGDCAF